MWYFGIAKDTDEWVFDCFETSFEEGKYKEITDEEHNSIVEQAQAQGKWIGGDENGNPILIDPPQPTEEEIKQARIKELEFFLSSTDWYVVRFADTGEPVPSEIKQQRQDARDEISRLRNDL
jgi:phosphoenolpyruvate carboxylase